MITPDEEECHLNTPVNLPGYEGTKTEKTHKESAQGSVSTEKNTHRKKVKHLVGHLQTLETSIAQTASTTRKFTHLNNSYEDNDRSDRRSLPSRSNKAVVPVLTPTYLQEVAAVWQPKMNLHIELADCYLQLIQLDYFYAEKKGLESLSWKRAIYSLIEQFRSALRICTEALAKTAKTAKTVHYNSDIPVITSTGMTFPKQLEDDNDDDDNKDPVHAIKIKEVAIIQQYACEFLERADEYYQRMILVLRDMDPPIQVETDTKTQRGMEYQTWTQPRRYKWHRCIPIRGDLARYQWRITLGFKGDSQHAKEARERAWYWYTLGSRLVPSNGKLYSHLSLLMEDTAQGSLQNVNMLSEMHKFYFSTRSLMVRRHGFLSAREGMVVLFENNRRWLTKYLEKTQSAQRKNIRSRRKERSGAVSTHTHSQALPLTADGIAGMLIRLHGMLFTKIGLDQFAQIKRRFFEGLFPSGSAKEDSITSNPRQEASHSWQRDTNGLNGEEMFWFETAILCISSLYGYNYSSSKLSTVILMNSKHLYGQDYPPPDKLAAESVGEFYAPNTSITNKVSEKVSEAWLIYIELLLHWMLSNCLCATTDPAFTRHDPHTKSLWENIVGPVTEDTEEDTEEDTSTFPETPQTDARVSNISPAFWSLLLQFLTRLLHSLSDKNKYDVINDFYIHRDTCEAKDTILQQSLGDELTFLWPIMKVIGKYPLLPEEVHMLGLGWVDSLSSRIVKIGPLTKELPEHTQEDKAWYMQNRSLQRKLKILKYGFVLVQHMHHVLKFNPVDETFTIKKPHRREVEKKETLVDTETLPTVVENPVMEKKSASSSRVPFHAPAMPKDTKIQEEEEEVDPTVMELKKRREQLQSMLVVANEERRFGYRKLSSPAKDRELRLSRLSERVLPGKTVLILDTNCFIGQLADIVTLFEANKWLIVVPLVVVTELDGIANNSSTLGTMASGALKLIEETLAKKQRMNGLRIQTSRNNFLYDISIRYEKFIFGESDKNLDDLVLSSCLWWLKGPHTTPVHSHVPACLVTGDRNLSVKARAREVEVVPVSVLMQLTLK
ncbi:hypothetical protein BDF14DRAFT_1716361 [Spinellus fusiger]|nr:hypothetical protein BDF14DRAFT_1716361 [Spinellus fusiger]